MGLLDSIFGSEEGRLGIGLLAAAMPSNVPQGQRLMGVLAQQDAWKQSQMDNKLMQAQLDDRTMQTQARRAQQEEAMRKRQAIPSLFSQSGAQGGASGGVGGFDVQAALAAGFDPEEIQKYAALQNLGRQEVARTIETTDAQGRPITVQLDKFGGRIGEGMGAWKAPISVNQGDRTTFVDPATMQQRGSFGMNMSPGERDASARGWAANALARQRLSFDQGGGAEGGGTQGAFIKQFGKAPPGYRWKEDGTAEAIPGGPADIKAGEAGVKAGQRAAAATLAAQNVLGAVSEAKGLVGINTAGPGSALSRVPGTDARDLSAKLETVKANLGFDRLQQMRDMSPTGGALGAVAVQELIALQSTVASLDQGQSPSQLKKSLAKIETHYNNWQKTLSPQADQTGGASGGWDAPATKPAANMSTSLPPANTANRGKVAINRETGERMRSNGMQWVKE